VPEARTTHSGILGTKSIRTVLNMSIACKVGSQIIGSKHQRQENKLVMNKIPKGAERGAKEVQEIDSALYRSLEDYVHYNMPSLIYGGIPTMERVIGKSVGRFGTATPRIRPQCDPGGTSTPHKPVP